MPTINQLVRKPRKVAAKKSKSPALGRIHNALDLQGVNGRKQGRSKYGAKREK